MKYTFNFDTSCPSCNYTLPDSWEFEPDQEFTCSHCNDLITIEVAVVPRMVYDNEPASWGPSTLNIAVNAGLDPYAGIKMHVSVIDSEPGGQTYMDAEAAREIGRAYFAAASLADRKNAQISG